MPGRSGAAPAELAGFGAAVPALRLLRGCGRGAPAAGPPAFLGLAGAAPLLSPSRYRIPPRRMISLEVLPRSPSKCALVPLP